MHSPSDIYQRISEYRGNRKLLSKRKARLQRRSEHERKVRAAEDRKRKKLSQLDYLNRKFNGFSYSNIMRAWLPPNLAYLTACKDSDFYIDFDAVTIKKERSIKAYFVPENFCLIDNPGESFEFIRSILFGLLCEKFDRLVVDYRHCKHLSIGAQVLLDILLKDVFAFYDKCVTDSKIQAKVQVTKKFVGCAGPAYTPDFVAKILFSVGSFAIHTDRKISYPDIITYPLCTHNREGQFNRVKAIERKDIDTTALADYVINSLAKMGKKLSVASLEDLCIVIGEVLINAEEHATTQYRFSIGYFQDSIENGKHVGTFRLVILNFGKTIYEKFSDPECPNRAAVDKMSALSEQYTRRRLFKRGAFDEETLWTLYALQDGITSVADRKRGHGSIQFIDSFFKLNGRDGATNEQSRMTILSGRSRITFNNKYKILEKDVDGEKIKAITFNDSGTFDEKPDKENVMSVNNYFPGTIISAKIIFDEEDFSDNENS